ncbi:hypothetical protein IEQ34_011029 [Dendrobium chrysotoxum]|uniref:H(+)/Pi cotransporter n=1 Tax=Dendrobium chrysotoxum TaxID=161865 RepID=A0AAV7GUD8_DENCH|nr:hypothetical protein IEQ34_011029 [Dendrobium chrysotoxum]
MQAPAQKNSDDPTAALLQTEPAARTIGGEEGMNVDEMLTRFAGEFGPWQLRQFLLTSLAWILCAFQVMAVVFADRESARPVPCPVGIRLGRAWWLARSTVEEWGLTCGEKYKVGLAQSAFFVGSMAGAAFFGHVSDSFLGRKGVLTLTCFLLTVFSLLTAFSPSFFIYSFLRFLSGLSTGGVGLSAFVLATEPVGPSFRAAAAMSTFHFFSIGSISLSFTSLLLPSWRLLYVATSLPSLLFLLLALPFISESPRWHLVHRNLPAAMQIIRAVAKTNGYSIPDRAILVHDADPTRPVRTASIVDVMRSHVTRPRLILGFLINFLISVSYYGLTLNVANLGPEIHASAILNAVAEMPAYALTAVALRWHGRRPMAVTSMWLCGFFCFAAGAFVKAARMGCAAVAIFAVAATYNLMYVCTAELFPTEVRNAALGCVTLAGQMGAVAAPVVVAVGGKWGYGVFGGCAVVAGGLGLRLPETRKQPLYETMAGLEGGEKGKGEAG